MNDFKVISKKLLPINYRSNKFLEDIIDVFAEYIIENSNILLDINNLFNEKNTILYEEVLKTFARNFYDTITNNSTNHKLSAAIRRAHEKWGFDFDDSKLNIKAIDLLNKSQLETFKMFQQSKGTINSIEFIYKIIEQLNIEQFVLETDGQLSIYPGENIFEYIVEGSMLPEVFDAYVKPLAHPVGWVCVYLRIYKLYFVDYFLSKEVYDIEQLEVSCDNRGDYFLSNEGHLFFTDIDNNIIYDEDTPKSYIVNGNEVFDVTRFGTFYDVLTEKSEINLVLNNNVKNIEKESIKGVNRLTIYFESGEYLEQISKPRSLKLYYGSSKKNHDYEVKKDYTNFLDDCSLKLKYSTRIVTTVQDLYNFQIDYGFADTSCSTACIGAGNLFVGSRSWILGEKKLLYSGDTTYKNRVRNEFLKSSNFKALYRNNYNEIRPVFRKITSENIGYLRHYDVNMDKTNDYFYCDIPNTNTFLYALDNENNKVEVGVVKDEEKTRIYSKNNALKIIYIENNALDKVVDTIIIDEDDIIENNEVINGKTYKYKFEIKNFFIINIYNNKKEKILLDYKFDSETNITTVYSDVRDYFYIDLFTKMDKISFLNVDSDQYKLFNNHEFVLGVFNNKINTRFDLSFNFDPYTNILSSNALKNLSGNFTIALMVDDTTPKTAVYFENHNIEERDLPIYVYLNNDYYTFSNTNDLVLSSNQLKLYFNEDIKNKQASVFCLNSDYSLIETIDFILTPVIKTESQNNNIYEIDFDTQYLPSKLMSESDIYKRESSLYYNHYVGRFATNDIYYTNAYVDTTHKHNFKAKEIGNSGILFHDIFDLESNVSSDGFDVVMNFNDHFGTPEDFINIEYTGFYQNKWGWQSGYVDVYDTIKPIPFVETIRRDESTEIYEMDDFIHIGSNDISNDYLFKEYPVVNKYYNYEIVLKAGGFNAITELDNIRIRVWNKLPDNLVYEG